MQRTERQDATDRRVSGGPDRLAGARLPTRGAKGPGRAR